jgi:hypothetical protein
MAFQLQKSDGNSATYADPTDADYTVRVKQTQVSKSLDGKPVKNWITEVIMGRTNPIEVEGIDAVDQCSVRLRISGAVQSAAALQAMADLLAGCIAEWSDEHWLIGFNPTSVPAIPE